MRLCAAAITSVAGILSATLVSSFVAAPSSITRRATSVSKNVQHGIVRLEQRGLAMATETQGDTWGAPPPKPKAKDSVDEWDEGSSDAAKRSGGGRDDVASESTERETKQPVLLPSGAAPVPSGRIEANPIEGFDSDDVPGKMRVDVETLAAQQKSLEKIAQLLRRERLDREAERSIVFGFCPTAELINGRMAMFGITVGLLTEFWTGQSLPQQVETMAQVIGLLPLDYETYFS